MKIAVIGCGAMGSVYAALLGDAGNEVWAIDTWREHVEAIKAKGLRVEGASGDRTVRVNASTNAADAGECELIIVATKASGVAAAAHIRADLGAGGKPGREALATLLAERQVRVVSYADWLKIEAVEVAAATPPAPRRKLVTLTDMMAVLDG